jgi:hypothetical protein
MRRKRTRFLGKASGEQFSLYRFMETTQVRNVGHSNPKGFRAAGRWKAACSGKMNGKCLHARGSTAHGQANSLDLRP